MIAVKLVSALKRAPLSKYNLPQMSLRMLLLLLLHALHLHSSLRPIVICSSVTKRPLLAAYECSVNSDVTIRADDISADHQMSSASQTSEAKRGARRAGEERVNDRRLVRSSQCSYSSVSAGIKERLHSERHKDPRSSPNKSSHRSALSACAYMDGVGHRSPIEIRELFARCRVGVEQKHLEGRQKKSIMVISDPGGRRRSKRSVGPLRRTGSYDKVDAAADDPSEWQWEEVTMRSMQHSSSSNFKVISVEFLLLM